MKTYKCVDCKDTGAVGDIRFLGGDYCTCQVGNELKEEIEATFEGCGSCGNIDTEAECHTDCPHYEIEISKCLRCGKNFEGPYGSSPCPECKAKCTSDHGESFKEMLPYMLPRKPRRDEEDIPF